MITIHWFDGVDIQEIPSNAKLPAKGHLVVRVHRGSVQPGGHFLRITDPLHLLIHQVEIPQLHPKDTFEIKIPLSTYMMNGKYHISLIEPRASDPGIDQNFVIKSSFVIVLESRRKPSQVFLIQFSMELKNLRKSVKSAKIQLSQVPRNFLLQSISDLVPSKGLEVSNGSTNLTIDSLWGMYHKTIKWNYLVQPAYLLLDTYQMQDYPDEYYILTKKPTYEDELGLEVSLIDLQEYHGFNDNHFPLKVLKDVISHVHKNMKYVRQKQERGLAFALKYGKGDCTEYASYAVGLLRKLGIKSKLVSGYSRSNANNWIAHAFCEVYVYGAWVPLDVMKPSIPYLQIGNRGDLIAISKNNWFSQDQREYKVEFMAAKGAQPQITLQHKVTESGVQKLPKREKKKSKMQLLTQRLKPDHGKGFKITVSEDKLIIRNILPNTESVLVIEGNIDQGKITEMQYCGGQETLHFQNNKNSNSILVGLDVNGFVSQVNKISN